MIAFPGARAAAIQLMCGENPYDQIDSDEDDDEEEYNDANAVVDPPPSSSPELQHNINVCPVPFYSSVQTNARENCIAQDSI